MSSLKVYGFIGIGIMGEGMASNLLKGGFNLVIWNRATAKSEALSNKFPGQVTIVQTAKEVVESCDVTFSMLSTIEASEAVFPGLVDAIQPGKSIVDCATLTPAQMQLMSNVVHEKGGRFLEAPVSGSRGPAAAGQLIFLCGGDEDVYYDIVAHLDLMGKARFFFGPVGAGTKMKLVVNMTMGSMMTALAEGVALAEASGLNKTDLLSVLDLGVMSNPMFRLKGGNMLKRDHTATQFPLKHAQKDMRFALGLGDDFAQQLPLAAAANEVMKKARYHGHDDDDFSAVYEGMRPHKPSAPIAVLFDFDGTLADTEVPSMEIAFWELAPYLPSVTAANAHDSAGPFMTANVGKAFELMVIDADKQRADKGLTPIEEARKGELDSALVEVVDSFRDKYGLPPLNTVKAEATSFLQMQKDETVSVLGRLSRANNGVISTLLDMNAAKITKYAIASTSGRPRVPVCVEATNLRGFFPDHKIHSGESDFSPPKFKPSPDVYLRAAQAENTPLGHCCAVEDSVSGVGSASNAQLGLIVGYVGANHIVADLKQSNAELLLKGEKSDNGRGADIVIHDFADLMPILAHFNQWAASGETGTFDKATLSDVLPNIKGKSWM
mmetsp:Transcript_11931/g.14433  ORF Transcript_11931/g.14433 Transcript_11931/m.14433 type:complete len:609 (-) Transcript_11931:178-2004(-)